MDHYHAWCNLKEGVKDIEFADRVHAYLGHLKANGTIAGYRLTRRKLGLGPPGLPEFHIVIEVEGLAQLDKAFALVASRADPAEGLHHAVNSLVTDASFALYRDFPDTVRVRGQETF
jgi:hypothetical protein